MYIVIITTHTAKDLGIVHISIIREAKEPRNLQNHRGDYLVEACVKLVFMLVRYNLILKEIKICPLKLCT